MGIYVYKDKSGFTSKSAHDLDARGLKAASTAASTPFRAIYVEEGHIESYVLYYVLDHLYRIKPPSQVEKYDTRNGAFEPSVLSRELVTTALSVPLIDTAVSIDLFEFAHKMPSRQRPLTTIDIDVFQMLNALQALTKDNWNWILEQPELGKILLSLHRAKELDKHSLKWVKQHASQPKIIQIIETMAQKGLLGIKRSTSPKSLFSALMAKIDPAFLIDSISLLQFVLQYDGLHNIESLFTLMDEIDPDLILKCLQYIKKGDSLNQLTVDFVLKNRQILLNLCCFLEKLEEHDRLNPNILKTITYFDYPDLLLKMILLLEKYELLNATNIDQFFGATHRVGILYSAVRLEEAGVFCMELWPVLTAHENPVQLGQTIDAIIALGLLARLAPWLDLDHKNLENCAHILALLTQHDVEYDDIMIDSILEHTHPSSLHAFVRWLAEKGLLNTINLETILNYENLAVILVNITTSKPPITTQEQLDDFFPEPSTRSRNSSFCSVKILSRFGSTCSPDMLGRSSEPHMLSSPDSPMDSASPTVAEVMFRSALMQPTKSSLKISTDRQLTRKPSFEPECVAAANGSIDRVGSSRLMLLSRRPSIAPVMFLPRRPSMDVDHIPGSQLRCIPARSSIVASAAGPDTSPGAISSPLKLIPSRPLAVADASSTTGDQPVVTIPIRYRLSRPSSAAVGRVEAATDDDDDKKTSPKSPT